MWLFVWTKYLVLLCRTNLSRWQFMVKNCIQMQSLFLMSLIQSLLKNSLLKRNIFKFLIMLLVKSFVVLKLKDLENCFWLLQTMEIQKVSFRLLEIKKKTQEKVAMSRLKTTTVIIYWVFYWENTKWTRFTNTHYYRMITIDYFFHDFIF